MSNIIMLPESYDIYCSSTSYPVYARGSSNRRPRTEALLSKCSWEYYNESSPKCAHQLGLFDHINQSNTVTILLLQISWQLTEQIILQHVLKSLGASNPPSFRFYRSSLHPRQTTWRRHILCPGSEWRLFSWYHIHDSLASYDIVNEFLNGKLFQQ